VDNAKIVYPWPSREEWARRRCTSCDSEKPHKAGRDLSFYASPEEIAAAISALRKIWNDYGRQMKAAAAEPVDTLRYQRREINDVIKQLHNGMVPWRWVGTGMQTPPLPLEVIIARYKAAVKDADERYVTKVAQAPIDDAAWERELARRRSIEKSKRVLTVEQ
jgi:hypothetical protein